MLKRTSERIAINGLIAVCMLYFTIPVLLFAQLTSGKIEGTVRDKDTGQPLAGVQVAVEGTRLGNVSNADGYYFILNVPPGQRSISFTFTGYQKTTVTGQLILAGQTTMVNSELSSTIVQLAGITIEGESQVLLPRDNTATKQRLTAEAISASPSTTLEDLLVLEAGVQIGGEGGMSRGLRIRGGRLGEEAMVVDGVLARNFTAEPHASNEQPNTGDGRLYTQEISSIGADSNPLEFSTGSVEEVDIITGGFQAEYGNAQSGIINIVTKEGGPDFKGSARYTTDEAMPRTADWGYNQLQANLGGPLPGIPNLFFNVSGEIQSALDGDPTHASEGFRGVNQDFVDRLNTAVANDPLLGSENLPYTLEMFRSGYDGWAEKTGNTPGLFTPGNPVRLPGNWKDRSLLSEKLVYYPFRGLKLIASDNYSRNQRSYPVANSSFRGGEGNYFLSGIFTREDFPNRNWQSGETEVYIPQSYGRRTRTYNFLSGFDWEFLKMAARNGNLQFRFSRFSNNDVTSSNLKTNYRREDQTTLWGWSVHDIPFEIESYPNWEFPKRNDMEAVHKYFPDGQTGAGTEYPYQTPFGMFMDNTTYWLAYFRMAESQLNYKADLDFQLNRQNRAKIGFQLTDFRNRELEIHNVEPQRQGENFRNEFAYQPRMLGLYAQNRTDLGDFIFDYGLRYDYFDPADNWGGRNGDNLGDRFFVKVLHAWSPRFNVAFPVTDRSQLRFSYGTFSQVPGTTQIFSVLNPGDLQYSRTEAFEAGISFLASSDVVLDVVAFYRDVDGNVTQKNFFRDYYRAVEGRRIRDWETGFTNGDIGNIKGFDFTVKKRFSSNLALNFSYTMQFSRTTGSFIGATPNAGSAGQGGRQGADNGFLDVTTNESFTPPDVLWPIDGDRTHELSALANYRLPDNLFSSSLANRAFRNINIYSNFALKSGQPLSDGATLLDSDLSYLISRSLLLNQFRGHWFYNLDLRITKGFELAGSRRVEFFTEIFNALNRKNDADYPSGYNSKEYLNVAGGVDLNWDDPSLDIFKQARFKNDYNQDGILTVEEQAKGAIAQDFMFATMNKRLWGGARQVRFGLNFSF